jgi:flavorubredoxin
MANREMLHKIVDYLDDKDIDIVLNLILSHVEDDENNVLTEEEPTDDDIIAIEEGRKEFLMGETISHNDVNWD